MITTTLPLLNKNILILAPSFFGYEKTIAAGVENLGGNVELFDERPGNDFYTKSLVRIGSNIIKIKTRLYYSDLLKKSNLASIDYVLIISPEAINLSLLKMMRKNIKNAIFILYMDDSIKNKIGLNIESILPIFDRSYSFDEVDCENNKYLRFRPLFYSDDYLNIEKVSNEYKYDLSFIGTAHSDRYIICKKINEQLMKGKMRSYMYLYLNDRRLYRMKRIINPKMRNSKIDEFQFVSLSKSQVIQIIKDSKVILDINHPKQNGLTMRSIEALGAKRKLITTNKNIAKYDFYNDNNISIIDREKCRINISFFGTSYLDIQQDIYQKYSLNSWIVDVFLGQ